MITEDKKLNEILERIVSKFSPDKVILFGSRAKNNHNNDSDYDLCVLKDDIISKKLITNKIYSSLLGLFASVDIIVEKTSNFEELKNNRFLIYSEIAKFGLVIYEK